jgi:hypothetical protein
MARSTEAAKIKSFALDIAKPSCALRGSFGFLVRQDHGALLVSESHHQAAGPANGQAPGDLVARVQEIEESG